MIVKELIHKVLMDTLNEKQYSSEEAKTWSREISENIKTKLKGTFASPSNLGTGRWLSLPWPVPSVDSFTTVQASCT